MGIQIYQRIKGNNGEWHTFAKPIYLGAPGGIIDNNGQNYIMDDNNPFVFEGGVSENNGAWRWQLIDNASKTGFPIYAIVNGTKVYYEYEAREIGVYTTIAGVSKASSADQLERVFDYTNTQEWSFDYQNKQPKGINVEAGKLKVTKTWDGGHVGSRIYFKLFRDDADITNDIIADPESYGLNEFQVYDDGTHKAIIVKCDGTNWEELLIQGLPIGPSGGGNPYQYSIKEVGYSEADGTDCWDGENVIEPDGSTRKDPHGNDITINIGGSGGLLTGYTIDSAGDATQIDGKSPSTAVIGDVTHTITAFNKYEEKYKDLEIKKIWTNQAGDFLPWPNDVTSITVDLYQGSTKVVNRINLFLTPPDQETKQEFIWNGTKYSWTVQTDASGKVYTFTFKDLPAKNDDSEDAVYSVRELAPSGDYTVSYGFITERPVTVDGKEIMKQEFSDTPLQGALNGNVIRNMKTEQGVELPSTGGPGTERFMVLGSILITGAGLLLWKRREIF